MATLVARLLWASTASWSDTVSFKAVQAAFDELWDLRVDFLTGSWTRFEIKQVKMDVSSYEWHKINMHSQWTPQANEMLCFDIPRVFRDEIWFHLKELPEPRTHRHDPLYLHVAILRAVLVFFDRSVWSMRDAIREIEQVGSLCDTPQVLIDSIGKRSARWAQWSKL